MLVSIQYARALAAMLVVCAHMAGFSIFNPLSTGDFGSIGVDVFFVISGFIMWETSTTQTPGDFAWRRVLRIVPTYWFYTLLLVVVAWTVPHFAPKVVADFRSILMSLLFVPYVNQFGQTNPLLTQGWTLNYEMYFYVVFGLSLFLQSRTVRLLFVAVVLVGMACLGAFFDDSGPTLEFYTGAMSLEFLFGIAVSMLYRRLAAVRMIGAAALTAGVVVAIVADLFAPDEWPRVLCLGVPAALFVLGLVAMEEPLRRHRLRALERVGDASYSLYLLHPFVLSAVAKVMARMAEGTFRHWPLATSAVFGVLAMGVSVGVAIISFRLIEQSAAAALVALGHWYTARRHRSIVA